MSGKTTPGQTKREVRAALRTRPTQSRSAIRRMWSRWYPEVQANVVHLRDFMQARMNLVSTVALVLVASVLLLGTFAHMRMTSVASPFIEVRQLRDPARARERIVDENFTTVEQLESLSVDPRVSETKRLVYRHAPLVLRYANEFPEPRNSPIGVYYTISQSTSGEATATTIRYFLWFVDESGGMPIDRRIANYGHSLDRELVYRVTLLGDEVVGAYYQAPGHRLIVADYDGEARPVFAVASGNHNFRVVTQQELLHPAPKILLAPLPHLESPWRPAHDPDFMALAVLEVWEKYYINMQDYVFVELELPPEPTQVTVSLRIDERWYYLHEQIGGGVARPGYNQLGVEIGYPVLPADISELRIVAFADEPPAFEIIRLSIYPRSDVPA